MASSPAAHVYIAPAAPHCTETDLAMPFIEAIARQHRLQLSAGADRCCRFAHAESQRRVLAHSAHSAARRGPGRSRRATTSSQSQVTVRQPQVHRVPQQVSTRQDK
ncbi:hypothetical protein Zmor_026013 [Zophobas morio]|uniref:Uncharacterized protein n=1 Tax=Zophobas morio TaxID=2755281 RepID=A0AA38HTT4_9CUCU|nr:hypothetical protein Zmor_026013 [Zophobas morio]